MTDIFAHPKLKLSFDDLVDRNIELEESVNSMQRDIQSLSGKVINKEQGLLKAKNKINEQFVTIKDARDEINKLKSELNRFRSEYQNQAQQLGCSVFSRFLNLEKKFDF